MSGPSYSLGWGAIDAEAAGKLLRGDSGSVFRLAMPSNGSYNAFAEASGGPLRLTVVWLDEQGEANAGGLDDRTSTLVNKLDVRIIAPNGVTYYPWSLNPEHPEESATNVGPNYRDNVLRVDIPNANAGIYSIKLQGGNSFHGRAFSVALSGLHNWAEASALPRGGQ
jgi:hypothetical protein